jgi:peptide/nickel transport system substrate-binding protein
VSIKEGASMTNRQELVPNERLRHARDLKGWSQADLAEQVGTSFEMVSRWERGSTVPGPHYRQRLCAVLGQSAEDLGLLRSRPDAFTPLPSPADRSLESSAAVQGPGDQSLLQAPPKNHQRRGLARRTAVLLVALLVLVIAGGILSSVSLLGLFSRPPATVVRGGTWIETALHDPGSLIPNGPENDAVAFDCALYLPLFFGDGQGLMHPAAATELPTVQNGGVSADATTWTFHLRPGLVWSDGQPYDARDVDFTWRLWQNPAFGAAAASWQAVRLITSAQVSPDHLSITFHLQHAYAPFLALWVFGTDAPLPAHHFSQMAPQDILQSPEKFNPQVVSGPFRLSESKPSDHYTLVRNPRYYRAREGLPYLDQVILRIADGDTTLKDLQDGTITSTGVGAGPAPEYQRLSNYTLVTSPTDGAFEGLFFNFHNTILSSAFPPKVVGNVVQ